MKLTDWLFGSTPTQLKLRDDGSHGTAKIGMPKPPPLETSLESLLKYSRKSELVYACIEKKAQAACDAEPVVEKRVNGEWQPVDAHPLTNLLNKPNPWDNGESFLRSWIASENFSDNFYCEIVRSGAGIPVGLYPLNPVYLVPQYVMRGSSWVIDFYYYYQTGFPIRLEVDDVLVRRRHGVGSIYSEVSAMQIVLASVDADAAGTDYVRAIYNNGGSPSGILVNKGRAWSDQEALAAQQKWTARYGRGGTSRGGIAVINAEAAEYQAVGMKLNEMGNGNLDDKTETRICMAFGVPPILIGALVGLKHITQNATSKSAMKDFWDHTLSPELKSIRKFLTWELLPMFEPIETIKRGDIRVNWDMSQVMALQDDMDAIAKRAVEIYKGGIAKLDEARGLVKLDAVGGEEGEAFFKAPAPTMNIGNGEAPKVPEKPKSQMEQILANAVKGDTGLSAVIAALAEERDVLNADTLEKKTFDFNGLTLGREPTSLEQTIDLKSMVADYETGRERMASVVLSIRDKLIIQSVKAVRDIDPKNVHELILTPPDGAYNGVRKALELLFEKGRSQVDDDLARQLAKASGKDADVQLEFKKFKDKWKLFLDRITERIVSRIINEITTRAINFFVSRGLLDKDDNAIIAELRQALQEQSDKTFEDIAAQAANSSIGAGRDAEIEDRVADWEIVEYSAILDANTCGPCEEADGMQAATSSELPDAPNPDCEGGARCRCFHIAIYKEENA